MQYSFIAEPQDARDHGKSRGYSRIPVEGSEEWLVLGGSKALAQ